MTNFEKYMDEILKMVNAGVDIAKKDDKIVDCDRTSCSVCDFSAARNDARCTINIIKWLYSKADPTLTKRERAFCEYTQGGYIARDEDNQLNHYACKPSKGTEGWLTRGEFIPIKYADFNFITWDDEKPWAVKDLLSLEVEE